MKLTEFFLAQLEREAPPSRRVLERVPEGRPEWKPHEKSMPLGYLAMLVATMPAWVDMAITRDSLDLHPPDGSQDAKGWNQPWTKSADLIQAMEAALEKTRAALRGTNDEFLHTTWKLLVAGNVVMESPRHAVIADTFTHLSHHRGQLSVYMRLCGAPVPSIYGPSADEQRF